MHTIWRNKTRMPVSTPHDLLSRANTLQDTLKQTLAQIVRLSKLPSTSPEEDTPDDLTADIHESLKSLSDDLAELHLDVSDLPAARRPTPDHLASVARLNTSLVHLDEDISSARARFRRAQLSVKRNQESAVRREREEYLRELQAAGARYASASSAEQLAEQPEQSQAQMSASLFSGRRREKRDTQTTQQDMLLTATSDVTASLRRTHTLLTSELSRSRFAQETLDASNRALEELNTRYGDLNDMLKASRGLVSTLLRSNKSDTWYLETSMYILLATLAWLVFRRLLYGPMWWIIWLPLRNMLKVIWFFGGAAVGLINQQKAEREVGRAMSSLTALSSATSTASAVRMEGTEVPQASVHDDDVERSAPGSLSEEIGSRAEWTMTGIAMATEPSQPEGQSQQGDGQRQEVRRGDQQPLRERDPVKEPPNPKKRMFEADKEDTKKRDEL